MLIQQFIRTGCALLLQISFGFGLAEPRPIDLGLLGREVSCAAFLKSVQIDQVAHDRSCHLIKTRSEGFLNDRPLTVPLEDHSGFTLQKFTSLTELHRIYTVAKALHCRLLLYRVKSFDDRYSL
jgi:hypothetical protein